MYVSLSHVQLRSVNFEGRDETYASRIVHRDESLSSKNYPLILLELLCIFFHFLHQKLPEVATKFEVSRRIKKMAALRYVMLEKPSIPAEISHYLL